MSLEYVYISYSNFITYKTKVRIYLGDKCDISLQTDFIFVIIYKKISNQETFYYM